MNAEQESPQTDEPITGGLTSVLGEPITGGLTSVVGEPITGGLISATRECQPITGEPSSEHARLATSLSVDCQKDNTGSPGGGVGRWSDANSRRGVSDASPSLRGSSRAACIGHVPSPPVQSLAG